MMTNPCTQKDNIEQIRATCDTLQTAESDMKVKLAVVQEKLERIETIMNKILFLILTAIVLAVLRLVVHQS